MLLSRQVGFTFPKSQCRLQQSDDVAQRLPCATQTNGASERASATLASRWILPPPPAAPPPPAVPPPLPMMTLTSGPEPASKLSPPFPPDPIFPPEPIVPPEPIGDPPLPTSLPARPAFPPALAPLPP